MSLAIADRFQAGESLTVAEKQALSQIIVNSNNVDDLVLAVGTYFEAFPCEGPVLARVKQVMIDSPPPNLAAACLRAIIEHCGEGVQQSLDYTRPFVDFSKFEGWTDEVIYSSNYFKRNLAILNPFDRKRLMTLIHEASRGGASELIELLT